MTEPAMEELVTRMKTVMQAGFTLVPLGRDVDGKRPAIQDWNVRTLGWDRFHKIMMTEGSTMYGIRLDSMVVVDVDVHDDALVARLEARFGPAAVTVRTPRGSHLYYRQGNVDLSSLRGQYAFVEFKGGIGHFIVGAGSVRPCGGRYVQVRGNLGVTTLTLFRDRYSTGPSTSPGLSLNAQNSSKVAKGKRHHHLLRRAVSFAPTCVSENELYENLIFVRDEECENPATLPDDEVRGIAQWGFETAVRGELYAASGGSFVVPRHFAKVLRGDADALALYVLLLEQHGHQKNKTFGLRYEPMKRDGLTGLSERAFGRAVKKLVEVGAIVIAANHQAGKLHRHYRLGFPAS